MRPHDAYWEAGQGMGKLGYFYLLHCGFAQHIYLILFVDV